MRRRLPLAAITVKHGLPEPPMASIFFLKAPLKVFVQKKRAREGPGAVHRSLAPAAPGLARLHKQKLFTASREANDYFVRFWSPRSPSPFLTTVVAFVRRSAVKERPTSSLSLNWPPLLRRTYRLSPLFGSISSRGIILSYGKTTGSSEGIGDIAQGCTAIHGFRVPVCTKLNTPAE
jgi:hypothetical protein